MLVALPYWTKVELMFIRSGSIMCFFFLDRFQQVPYLLSIQQPNLKEIAGSLALDGSIGLLPVYVQNGFLADRKGDEHGKPQ